jgi:hypothetical protein
MYLDIIRLYTAAKDFEIAQKTLTEFETRFADFRNYPDAALKLADAYIAAGKAEKEREIYQNLLDFLGKSPADKFPYFFAPASGTDITQIKPETEDFRTDSNPGIRISKPVREDDYYYPRPKKFVSHLFPQKSSISYGQVLSRLVSSLAAENKTQEILARYADEIA